MSGSAKPAGLRALRAAGSKAARWVSPRHRAWQSVLDSCQLDPASVDQSQTPGERDILVGGVPRSGTALLTSMLHRPSASIAVMEPWDALRLPPRYLMGSLRQELAEGALARGRLDYAAVADGRVAWTRDGERHWPMHYHDDTMLIVKFPTFWQYLDRLPEARFVMCVRHPEAAIASFTATGGRLAAGLEYDVTFNRDLNARLLAATADPAHRRALLYSEIVTAIADAQERPNVLVVRYEDWWDRPDALLDELESFVGVALRPPTISIHPPTAGSGGNVGELPSVVRVAERLGYSL